MRIKRSILVLSLAVGLAAMAPAPVSSESESNTELEPITLEVSDGIRGELKRETVDNFIKQAVLAFNRQEAEKLADDVQYLQKLLAKSSYIVEKEEVPDHYRRFSPYHSLNRFLQIYQGAIRTDSATEHVIRVGKHSSGIRRVVRLEFEQDIQEQSSRWTRYSTAFRGIHPIAGRQPGLVYKLAAKGKLGDLVGHVPGNLALKRGTNRLRVYFGRSYYDLVLDVNGGVLKVAGFDFSRSTGICWEVSGEEIEMLDDLKAALVGQEVQLGPGQKLVIPYRLWGHDDCRYSLSFGSAKYYVLRLTSSPPEASVLIDGVHFGTTPTKLMVRRNFRTLKVIFRKVGHADAAIDVNLENHASGKPIVITADLIAE